MPNYMACEYYYAIEGVRSREYIAQLTIADYPNSKKQSRDKIYKELHNKAYPGQSMGQKVSEDEILRMLGNG